MIKDIVIVFFIIITVLDVFYINKFNKRIKELASRCSLAEHNINELQAKAQKSEQP